MKQNQRETFRLNNVSSSHGQCFSHTNGRSCWSACIRRCIRVPSVILYHTRLLARLFARSSEALPCHLSNTHGHAGADIYTCLPAECQHVAFIDTETQTYIEHLVWAKREFLNGSISCNRHHCLLFSSVSNFHFVILILLALCLIRKAEEGQASTENTLKMSATMINGIKLDD